MISFPAFDVLGVKKHMAISKNAIRAKFGGDYAADENTYKMGIDIRFTSHIAERFQGLHVLETCTGAGFSTISIAKAAASVRTIEIDQTHQQQARSNVDRAGFLKKVQFIHGDCLDVGMLKSIGPIDAVYLDPDWAETAAKVIGFVNLKMRPPADTLFEFYYQRTGNIALILPPSIAVDDLAILPEHEREKLFMDGRHELYCLYFGDLIRTQGESEFRV